MAFEVKIEKKNGASVDFPHGMGCVQDAWLPRER